MRTMKTKPNNSDWQERFDKWFNHGTKLKPRFILSSEFYNEVKSFISSELQREREAKIKVVYNQVCEQIARDERLKTLKEVEGIIKPDESEETYYEEDIAREARNELIYELLSKIKELK